MTDLRTNYLGLSLKNPLVVGASPLTRKLPVVKQLEDEGVSALVMYSLFEEEITHESLELDYFLNKGTETQPEAQTYLVEPHTIEGTAERYLEQLRKIKEAVDIPVIASLNGTTAGGWLKLAMDLESAGADALELNIYTLVTDRKLPPEQVEKNYLNLIRDVRKTINIPITVKLSPYFTNLPNFMEKASKAGAEGFVLFNRFLQPDFDIESLDVDRKVRFSTSADLAMPARWIAIMSSQTQADLALSGGVHTAPDMVKGIMAGAKVILVVSEFLQNGIQSAGKLLLDLQAWMNQNGYDSVEKMRGTLSLEKVENSAAYERANYVSALHFYNDYVQ